MFGSTIEALFIFVFAVLPCAICGYLITFKGRRSLITGYKDGSFAKPKAFGKSIGISLLLFAICLTIIAYFWHLNLLSEKQMSSSVLLLVIAVLLNYVYAYVKYRKK